MTPTLARSEGVAVVHAVVTAAVMIAQQVAGKATRDALLLMHYDVRSLPGVVVVAAVASLAAVLVVSRLLARHGPMPLVPRLFAVSASAFVLEWILVERFPVAVAFLLYLHMAIFGAILISGFWSVVNERFDAQAGKRVFARIAAAATFGGVVGGLVSSRVTAWLDLDAMLLVLAALHVACAIGSRAVGAPETPGAPRPAVAEEGFAPGVALLVRTPFLGSMSALVALSAFAAALLDWAFKAQAAARFEGGEALVTFFGSYYAVVGVLTFVLQGLFGPRLLRQLGLAGTTALLPGAVVAGGIVATAVPGVWTLLLLRGAESVTANSFFRSAFELLYTPIRTELKRPTKTIIDVASNRLGDMLGGGLLVLLIAVAPDLPPSFAVTLAMVVSLGGLYVVTRLHRGYVVELARSLRAGSMSLGAEEVLDATTRRALAEIERDDERQVLLRRIAELEGAPRAPADGLVMVDRAQLLAEATVDLLSRDEARIRRVLGAAGLEPALVPHLLPLLGDERVAEDVKMELRWMAPRILGLLGDALVDADTPLAVRQRIPTVLEICHNPRAVEALVPGLGDADFSVRFKCARVLSRMTARSHELRVRAEDAFACVRRELAVDERDWLDEGSFAHEGEPAEAMDGAALGPSLQHVFTLLGMVLDREAIALSVRALAGPDAALRGTAFEYLENVLPEDVRRMLWARLGVGAAPSTPRRRSREEALDALVRSADRPSGPGRG